MQGLRQASSQSESILLGLRDQIYLDHHSSRQLVISEFKLLNVEFLSHNFESKAILQAQARPAGPGWSRLVAEKGRLIDNFLMNKKLK